MTTRSALSRESSRASLASTSRSYRSRRLSNTSDDNVFSDEYALDETVTIDNAPLGHVPPPRQQYFDDPFHDRNASSSSLVRNGPPPPLDRSSIAKRRLMIDDIPTTSNGALGRSLSTSSRITIPRSQSPYVGPTAPSHPYGMYPQMTRASSVASRSTFRPGSETPFVPRGGPEHPYDLYPQNTAPEEEDEDITSNGIPLGFPRTNFQPSSGGSSSDVGDIIGSDGHIEQLPPYTRYADNTVAKGDMNSINRRRSSRVSCVPTQATVRTESSSQPAAPSAADSTTLLAPREQFEEETEAQRARKEGWKSTWRDKALRRTVVGLPCWGLIVIVAIVICSATIGGVVGGVIGNRQGAQRAYANGAVTTIWLDAVPTTLGPNSSPLPTGHYQIPFNQSQEIKECIPNVQQMGPAWGCMDIAYIGVSVFEDKEKNCMSAAFEDFSVNTQDFKYGPQPPDFNGTAFDLTPMQDKDAGQWGVAMFFSVLFDKLTILPADIFDETQGQKRSIDSDIIARSVAAYDGMPLQAADQPWFCFWNSTINELFIYLNEQAPSEPNTTTTSGKKDATYTTPSSDLTTTAARLYGSATSAALMQQVTTATTGPTPAPTTFQAYNPTPPQPQTTAGWTKRSYETSQADVSNYPKLIKMVEKRKPKDPSEPDYVLPYCQKMQVLDDWSIVPIMTVPTISIEEKQYATSTASSTSEGSNNKRLLRSRDERDVVSDLESYCICEWTSY